MISENILRYLKKAGWSASRKIDIEIIKNILKSEGYSTNPIIEEFLHNFGGIEIEHPAFGISNVLEKCHFDPLIASDRIYRERVEIYEKRVNEPLVVIGEAYNEHLVLMMSHTGKVYGAYDEFLTLLGDNIWEAFESIYNRSVTREIP